MILHLRQERELGRKPLSELVGCRLNTRRGLEGDIDIQFVTCSFSHVWCACVCVCNVSLCVTHQRCSVHPCLCVCEGLRLMLEIILEDSHLIYWNSVCQFNPELTNMASLVSLLGLGITYFSFSGLDMQADCHGPFVINMDSGLPTSSELHACRARIFTMKTSLQPLSSFLKGLKFPLDKTAHQVSRCNTFSVLLSTP